MAVGVGPAAGVLERERELRALDVLLEDARRGGGRPLVIEAPPGLGKSTLLGHAAAMAGERGMLVLRAAGRELEHELGWGVARSLFESWLLALPEEERVELLAGPASAARRLFLAEADVAGPAGPEAAFALLHGLYWLTVRAAERRPLLLVVDDAQWSDEPSLRFLLYLLARLADVPAALLVAARSGQARADGGLLASLLSEPDATVLGLAPLSPAAVGALVRARVGSADEAFCTHAFEWTAGNPLLVRELLTAMDPEAVADLGASAERAAAALTRVVPRRLSALPEDAQALARALAVLEGGVGLDDARAVAGLAAEQSLQAADALARADIIAGDDPLEFVHPLMRAAVYGALGRHERADLHGRAARRLRARDAPVEQVSAHLLLTVPGGDADTVAVLLAAAAEAVWHGVPSSAIAYLERALREPPEPATRTEVLVMLARAELLGGRREAVEHFEQAIATSVKSGERARLWLELGRALHDFGRLAEACAACERGLGELDDGDGRDELSLDLQAWYLTSAMLLADRAEEAQRRAVTILRGEAAATRAGRTLQSKALNLRLYPGGTSRGGTAGELQPLARLLWAGGRLLAEDGLGTQAVIHVAGALSYCDDYDTASAVLESALTRARREGWATYMAAAFQLLARQKLWTGPLPDAIENAQAAFEIFAEGKQLYLPASGYCLARGLLESGASDDAGAVLARVDAASPVGVFAAWRAEATGRLAARRGDAEAAVQALLECGERLREVRITNPGMFHWRSEAGLAALRTGDRQLAERLIGEERRLAETFGAPRAIGVAQRAAGLLARGEQAVALLGSAAELHASCGAWLEYVLSLTELGGAIRRNGRASEARVVLRDAIARADRLGAAVVATRARAELTRAGGRPPAARDTGGELTPSERRVAELAAAGRTNRQIADELFVTVKAVEWHLGNVYRKLDIRGRQQLASTLARAASNPHAASSASG